MQGKIVSKLHVDDYIVIIEDKSKKAIPTNKHYRIYFQIKGNEKIVYSLANNFNIKTNIRIYSTQFKKTAN